jgi:hypothetical protein
MASMTRRALSRGCCRLAVAVVLALAVVASVAGDDESNGPDWHVVSVTSLLPSAVCAPKRGRLRLFRLLALLLFWVSVLWKVLLLLCCAMVAPLKPKGW